MLAPVRICWADTGGKLCGGKLDWRHEGDYWRSRCPKCKTQSRAASGEAAQLDAALEVRP